MGACAAEVPGGRQLRRDDAGDGRGAVGFRAGSAGRGCGRPHLRAYALRNEALRERFRRIMAKGYDAGAAWFRSVCEAEDLPMPPDTLVRVINVLIEGLLFQRFLTPELITDDVFYAAFAALAGERTPAPNEPFRPAT